MLFTINRVQFVISILILFQTTFAGHSVLKEYGMSFITNFHSNAYKAEGQNWATVQDSDGMLYFANSGGVILQFDGTRWNSIPVGNGSIVRDIQRDESGNIFVAMQNELGYLHADSSGSYVFTSLRPKIKCIDSNFGDIWKTVVTKDAVYFLERHHLFRFSKRTLTDSQKFVYPVKAKGRFHNLFKGHENDVFVQQMGIGLQKTEDDTLCLLKNGDFFKNDLLTAVLPFNKTEWLVITRSRGLFIYSELGSIRPFGTNCSTLLQSSHLYHAIWLKDGNLAIASKYGGLFILSPQGNLLQKIDQSVGLADNTVWSVFQDANQGIWLSLNKGIAFVDYASPFTNFDERSGIKGSVHDVIRHNGKLFITTNYGLFMSEPDQLIPGRIHFKKIPGISTSGWDMLSVWNTLLICANSGIYRLKGKQARLLFKYDPWVLYQSKTNPERIFIGLASGVASFYRADNGIFKDEGKIPLIDIEARTLAEDSTGNLWAASLFHGVLHTDSLPAYFSKNKYPRIRHFTTQNGLPVHASTLLFEYQNQILFSTSSGIYRYDSNRDCFIPNADFQLLNRKKQNDSNTMLTSTDENGNIWNQLGQQIVLNRPSNTGPFSLIDTLFWGIPKENIQCIYPEDKNVVWFGHCNGLFKYSNIKKFKTSFVFKSLIRNVLLNNHIRLPGIRSISYHNQIPQIKYTTNNMLRFQFTAPFFIHPEQTVYRYQLQNFDNDWSNWTSEAQKDYTNLPDGAYTFTLKAKNVYGQIRKAESYSFIIIPPWYRTDWAYFLYVLLFAGFIALLSRVLISYSHSKALAELQRKEKQRRKTEEAIRSQVAADFHDELGTRITRISLFSEILKNDLGNASDSTQNYLQKISKNAERLYDETRDFIWQLDPQKDSLLDFISRIKSFGDELFEDTDIQFELKHEMANPERMKLEMNQRRNLIRIIKEGLHNALKYAHCKNVFIQILRKNRTLSFIIQDDGAGFPLKAKSDGIGLQNMRIRAQKIKADFKLQSEINRGTQIKVSIEL